MESETISKKLSDEFVPKFPKDLKQNKDIWYHITSDENGDRIFIPLENNATNS